MFRGFLKAFAGHKDAHELPRPVERQTCGLEDLLAGEGQGERIPLGAIHAQFDTVGQKRAAPNPRSADVVQVLRVPHEN